MEGILHVSPKELNLLLTLNCGQCFRWRSRVKPIAGDHLVDVKPFSSSQSKTWFGIIRKMVFELTQYPEQEMIKWRLLNDGCNFNSKKRRKLSTDDVNEVLYDYFQLKVPLEKYYQIWSKADSNFAEKAIKFTGIRMLRQDPVENLFSFICSSNNNIPRITTMVEAMCTTYGEQLMIDDEFGPVYEFPRIINLVENDVETALRKMNFGYRAKFIHGAAKTIVEMKPEKWLYDLRSREYGETHQELQRLPGVGAKVADCVCLMSLDKHEAIPVDTHVWKIALTTYLPHLKRTKSMTDRSYREIGDFFRKHFGSYAGWAHSILFAADLKRFQEAAVEPPKR
ncbi:8-oxoguanine DNA glycosylase isoform X2 [Brevipalpus obovatus]|uniref:8-oxoguanine DNA glycosylase isoform X2 n=1 Tax=Brevipalpus obovatus TaxID=246614 RepID=UPI003D9E7B06